MQEIAGRDARVRKHHFKIAGVERTRHYFAEHVTIVRGEREVAAFIELVVVEAGPASVDLAAFTSPPRTNIALAWP